MARRRGLVLLTSICALAATALRAAQTPPLAGCYARDFDAAEAKAHPGQLVRRAQVSVVKPSAPETPGETQPVVADALLAVWSGETAFSTVGACVEEGDSLVCNAAFSAQAAPPCKSREEGVRDCRIALAEPGSFRLARRPEGVWISVRERLELPGPPGGRFLYLDPDNAGNRAFLMRRVSDAACK